MRRQVKLSPAEIALHQAAIAGGMAGAREALAARADANAPDGEHCTSPLQSAPAFGHADVQCADVQYADVQYADENEDTPLGDAVGRRHAGVARLLPERSAEVAAADHARDHSQAQAVKCLESLRV